MAEIVLTIPDAVLNRVIDALSQQYGYRSTVLDVDQVTMIPNPMSPVVFIKRKMLEKIRDQVITYEYNLAVRDARATIEASVDTDIQLS